MRTIPALGASESQASTQSLTTSTSSSSPQPTSALPGSPQTATPYANGNESSDSSNSSSSSAVSIGVGVGVGVGGALALGLGAFLFLRRRRNKKPGENTAELDTQEERLHPQEKPADAPFTKYSHRGDPAVHELRGEQGTGPHEMESHPTYELQGSDGHDQGSKH
jgi:MYXO-CTERM domain-containing protein